MIRFDISMEAIIGKTSAKLNITHPEGPPPQTETFVLVIFKG